MTNSQKPLILVTNDDGIQAPGIRILIQVAKEFGDVIVVAPDSPQSAKSHSITTVNPLSVRRYIVDHDILEYSCSGTPVDCVKIAIHKLTDRLPDLILSGINHGTNTSTSVIYSGTMAAAVEGSMNEISSIGFSVDNFHLTADFTSAIPHIRKIITQVLRNPLPANICLNVNFPDVEKVSVKGIKICRMCDGVWKEQFVDAHEPHGRKTFWLTGSFTNREPDAEDTDEYALSHGFASIVPIKVDFTAYPYIEALKEIDFA
jgi:5'-nucleotidase